MHLFVAGNFDSKTEFNFNSDLSGNVEIRADDGPRFSVPAKHLLQFAAEIVRRQRIAALESAHDAEILSVPESFVR